MLKTDWNICYLTMTFIYFWSFCKLNTGVMRLHIRILCQHTFARTPLFRLWIDGGHLTESVSVWPALEADLDYLEIFDELWKAQNRDMLVQWSLILISNHIVQNWQTNECTLEVAVTLSQCLAYNSISPKWWCVLFGFWDVFNAKVCWIAFKN